MLSRFNAQFPPRPVIDGTNIATGLFFLALSRDGRTIEILKNPARGSVAGGSAGGIRTGSPYGEAKEYDGTAATDTILDSTYYPQVTNSFTIQLLVRITDTARTNSYLMERGGAANQQFAVIYGYTANTVEFYAGVAFTGTDPRTGSGISVNDTNWHSVVYRYDGVTWSGFLDGAQQFSTSRTFSLTEPTNLSWYFGGSDAGDKCKAVLAMVGVWSRAVTDAEVRELWLRPQSLFVYPRTPLSQPISGFPQTVTLGAAVGPHRNILTPIVAGPITMGSAVIGPRSVPSPLVSNNLIIAPTAPVAGPRSIPSPVVAHVQVIRPAAPVTGPRAVYAPVVSGSPQYISVYTVKGPRQVGYAYVQPGGGGGSSGTPAPVIGGGTGGPGGPPSTEAVKIFIGGVDVTQYFSWVANTCHVESQTIGRWKMTFDLEVGDGFDTWYPRLGQTFAITDYGYRIFAGCISNVQLERVMMTSKQLKWHMTAVDKSAICDHRVVPIKTWAAGEDVVATIQYIVANYLNGEGIIPTGLPTDGSLGTLENDLISNFNTVTNLFDQICTQTGTVWWVNVDGILFFSSLTTLPAAPFGFTETSNNWRKMTVTQTTDNYYNKMYAVTNLNVLPGSGSGGTGGGSGGAPATATTQTFTWTAGQPGIITGPDPITGLQKPTMLQVGAPISSIVSMTVNGVAQTSVDFGAYKGQSYGGGADLLWFFGGPATGNPGQFLSPTALPSAGATIVVSFIPAPPAGGAAQSASTPQYGTALVPTGDPFGTCGSGWYEGVVQVKNISSQADLNAIAAAVLNRIGGIPQLIQCETLFPGLATGQFLMIDLPLSGVNNLKTLITGITGVMVPPTLDKGGSFIWTVDCRSNLDPGNWIKWFERLIERTDNPLPVLQYEECTFVLGIGSTVSSGVSVTNPYIVGRTGKLVEIMVAASQPQTGADLVLDITDGASVIASITLPAGTAANVLVTKTIPTSPPLYVFAKDVLNVNATYAAVGGTLAKASGVTAKLRWSM